MQDTNAPTIQVGKQGLTDSLMMEISRQLKQKKLIRVKFLRSSMDIKTKKELFAEVEKNVSGTIIHTIGFVITLKYQKA